MLDDIDMKIINLLQKNARLPNAEIARFIGMAPSATLERLRKLEEQGYITGYEARVNPSRVGLGLLAFVFVKATGPDDCGEQLARIPEVQEVHNIAGEDCYIVKVRTKGTEELAKVLREKFRTIPSIISTKTTVVLTTIKESGRLPLPDFDGE